MMIKKCVVVILVFQMVILSSCHTQSSVLTSESNSGFDVEKVTDALYDVMKPISEEMGIYFFDQAQYAVFDIDNDGKNEMLWICAVNGLTLLDIKIYVFEFDGFYAVINNEGWITKSYEDLKNISIYQKNGQNRLIIESETFSSGELRKCFRIFNNKLDLLDTFYSIEVGETYTAYHNEEIIDGDLRQIFNAHITDYQFVKQATVHTVEDYITNRNKITDILANESN